MDVLSQQKKLYSDPHFGNEKRSLLAKLFETVKTALTPRVVRGSQLHSLKFHRANRSFAKEFNPVHLETYTIFRNGVHHETFFANEYACKVEIIALQKKYPHDDWTFVPGEAMPPKKPATVAA